MNKVSVIIPAYNAVETVEKTVRNVLSSTIQLDVYVVDDGSTDGTGLLLDELKSTIDTSLSNLIILHQSNQGAYMARLNALMQIKTQYFGFVDADDTIEPRMFEKMLKMAEKENCDVVQCGVDGVTDSDLGDWYLRYKNKIATLRGKEEIKSFFILPHLVKGQGASFIWNKLYRNQYDFSKFVTFDHFTNYDDMVFNFQFFEKAESMGFLPDKFYHYAATVGSVTHSYGCRQHEDFMSCIKFRKRLGITNTTWLILNLKSALSSIARADISFAKKIYWIGKLIKDV